MLDPQVQAFLDELAALNLPPIDQVGPELAREQMRAERASMGPSAPVARIRDCAVPGPAGEIPIRVYAPENSAPLPVLVYFHGGGWVLGDLDTHHNVACSLANKSGCMVVAVDYRRAPEHKYPAAAEDCYAAAQWLMQNAGSLGGDASRVAIGGDSAGGNLAAAVTLMARDRGGRQPQFQVLVYPVADHSLNTASYRDFAEGYLLSRSMMAWFWDCYLPKPADGQQPYASPLRAKDLRGLPPALVLTAEYDPLRDEGEAYAARLCEAGVPVTLTRYDGMIHAFFSRLDRFELADIAHQQVAAALRKAFGL